MKMEVEINTLVRLIKCQESVIASRGKPDGMARRSSRSPGVFVPVGVMIVVVGRGRKAWLVRVSLSCGKSTEVRRVRDARWKRASVPGIYLALGRR